jgi:tetraacyldisaccharide 4'-kinase
MRRPWAVPLMPLYGLGIAVKNLAYDRGLLPPRRLQRPVVSVGSLSAGGAGKTPVVMALAVLLQREGFAVDVLSRGYGRGSGVAEPVDPTGLASRYGDEPMEMARAGLRVFVGSERLEAGTLAESKPSEKLLVHLLDDGFQHRRLARDLDVVLLTAADAHDSLLPGGNLRESASSLRRADVIVLRENEARELAATAARYPQAQVWTIRRELILPSERPQRMVAFCGIARPASFFAMLRAAGCELAGEIAFPDHHAYETEDYLRLVEAVLHAGADGLITTAKDAVKIPRVAMTKLNGIAEVVVARLEVVLTDETLVIERIRQAVPQ